MWRPVTVYAEGPIMITIGTASSAIHGIRMVAPSICAGVAIGR